MAFSRNQKFLGNPLKISFWILTCNNPNIHLDIVILFWRQKILWRCFDANLLRILLCCTSINVHIYVIVCVPNQYQVICCIFLTLSAKVIIFRETTRNKKSFGVEQNEQNWFLCMYRKGMFKNLLVFLSNPFNFLL